MKKTIIVLMFMSLTSCQFFLPTSSIDNEPQEIWVNDSLFLIQDFNYSLIKKNKEDQSDLVICDSIDSLSVGRRVIIFRKNNYFTIEKEKLVQTKINNLNKFKTVKEYFK
jgi:hypothetical protein